MNMEMNIGEDWRSEDGKKLSELTLEDMNKYPHELEILYLQTTLKDETIYEVSPPKCYKLNATPRFDMPPRKEWNHDTIELAKKNWATYLEFIRITTYFKE